MSRSLDDLATVFRPYADTFLSACKVAGLDILVTSTLRTAAEQQALYDQGRTKPGRIVTNAKPGSSAHGYGLAMDAYPLIHGKLATNTTEGDQLSDPLWQQYGKIARDCGLEWGGDFPRGMAEGPHVQMPRWRDYR